MDLANWMPLTQGGPTAPVASDPSAQYVIGSGSKTNTFGGITIGQEPAAGSAAAAAAAPAASRTTPQPPTSPPPPFHPASSQAQPVAGAAVARATAAAAAAGPAQPGAAPSLLSSSLFPVTPAAVSTPFSTRKVVKFQDATDGAAIEFHAMMSKGAYYSVAGVTRPVFAVADFGKDDKGYYIEVT